MGASTASPTLTAASARARWLGVGGFFFAMVTGGLVSLHEGRDVASDLALYHYVDPYWILVNHLRDIDPAGGNSYFNPTLDLPIYLGIQHLSTRELAFCLGAWQGLIAPATYLIARRVQLPHAISLGLAGASLFTGAALSEYGSSQGDLLIAPIVLFGIWLLVRSYDDDVGHRVGHVVGGAALIGAAAGLKWVVIPFVVGSIVALTCVAAGPRDRAARAAASVTGAVGGVLVTYGWWGVILWRNFGTVIFPMYNNILHSPDAGRMSFTGVNDGVTTLWSIISFPFAMNSNPFLTGPTTFRALELPVVEVVLVALLGVVLVASLRARRWTGILRHPARRALVALTLVTYLVWVVSTGIYRYMAALEILSLVVVVMVLAELGDRVGVRRAALGGGAVLIVAILCTQSVPNWGRSSFGGGAFSVRIPRRFRQQRDNFILIDDAPNGFVIPMFPAADEFVRSSEMFRITPAMAAVARTRLPASVPTYVLWGDPSEMGQSPMQVDPSLADKLAALGFAAPTTRECLSFPVSYTATPYELEACPVAPLPAARASPAAPRPRRPAVAATRG